MTGTPACIHAGTLIRTAVRCTLPLALRTLWVVPRVERVGDATCEIDRRRSRMAAAMHLKCPPRLLGLANERTRLPVRRWPAGKVDCLGPDSAEAKRRRHAPMAGAGRGVRGQATVRPGERLDCRARVLEALAQEIRRYPERLGRLPGLTDPGSRRGRRQDDAVGRDTEACRSCSQSSPPRPIAIAPNPPDRQPTAPRPGRRRTAETSTASARRGSSSRRGRN